MPQPAPVGQSAEALIRLFAEAETRLRARFEQAATTGNAATRLATMLAAVDEEVARLTVDAEGWYQQQLPLIYGAGATDTGLPFTWGQIPTNAVEQLAATNWADLLSQVHGMADTTKAALQELARAGSLDVVGLGDTANTAGLELTNYVQDLLGQLITIEYANGAEHALADWADTAIRTQTALAYNSGAIDQFKTYGVQYVEISDGLGCGLTEHGDGTEANGMVVDVATAEEYPIAHPRCARSFSPTEITNADDALAQTLARDPDIIDAGREAEAARAAAGTVTGRSFTVPSEAKRVDQRAARAARDARGARAAREARAARV